MKAINQEDRSYTAPFPEKFVWSHSRDWKTLLLLTTAVQTLRSSRDRLHYCCCTCGQTTGFSATDEATPEDWRLVRRRRKKAWEDHGRDGDGCYADSDRATGRLAPAGCCEGPPRSAPRCLVPFRRQHHRRHDRVRGGDAGHELRKEPPRTTTQTWGQLTASYWTLRTLIKH